MGYHGRLIACGQAGGFGVLCFRWFGLAWFGLVCGVFFMVFM